MKGQGRYKGFTLTETMIGFILSMMIVGILFNFLIFSNFYWRVGEARGAVSTNCLIALERMERELRSCPYGSITNNTLSTPKAISFASCRDSSGKMVTDSYGEFQVQKKVIFYIPRGQNILKRIEFPSSDAEPLTVSELLSYCDGRGQTIARNISNFAVTCDDVNRSIEMQVDAEIYNGNRRNTMSLKTIIFL